MIDGAFNVTKVGAGTTTFSATNTYSGTTTITAGILSINGDRALGATPGSLNTTALTLNGGALQGTATFTLDSNRGITLTANSGLAATSSFVMTYGGVIAGAYNLTINGASQTGTVILSGANTYSGVLTITSGTLKVETHNSLGNPSAITNNGALDLAVATTGTISQVISGTGTLTQSGSGSTTLSGANTFTGNAYVNAGTVVVTNTAGLGGIQGSTTVNGGTLELRVSVGQEPLVLSSGTLKTVSGTYTSSGAITLSGSMIIDVEGNLTLSGAITGSGITQAITKTGTGTLVLGSGSSQFGTAGATGIVVSAGTLRAGTSSSASYSPFGNGTVVVDSGAVIDLASYTIKNALSLTGTGIGGTGVLIDSVGNGTASGTVALTGASSIGGTGSFTVSGVISGSNDFTKVGTGAVTLSGTNTYTSLTTITGGTLIVTNTNSLGSVSSGTTVGSSGTLDVSTATLASEPVQLNGGEITTSANGTIQSAITLGATGNFTANTSRTLTVSGVVSGSYGITIGTAGKTGAVIFSNSANSYSGFTTISAGTLRASAANAFNTSTITVNSGASLIWLVRPSQIPLIWLELG